MTTAVKIRAKNICGFEIKPVKAPKEQILLQVYLSQTLVRAITEMESKHRRAKITYNEFPLISYNFIW